MITSLEGSPGGFTPMTNTSVRGHVPYKRQIQELRSRILRLETKNRIVCEKYKHNLKQGFELKINTHRLDCSMNRHLLKEKKEVEVEMKNKQMSEERRRRVKDQKLERLSSRMYIVETMEERAEKARTSLAHDKELNEKRIIDNQQKELLRKKNLRSTLENHRIETKKAKETLRQQISTKQREGYALQMKRELEQILEKEDVLDRLREELRELERDSPKEA